MKKVYRGWVGVDGYGFVVLTKKKDDTDNLDEKALAEILKNDWPQGSVVFACYYIAGHQMTEAEAIEMLARGTFMGDLDREHILDAYSEFTVNAMEQWCKIGGHDLITELETYTGKYAVVILESPEIDKEAP